jgi:hypothetical protein
MRLPCHFIVLKFYTNTNKLFYCHILQNATLNNANKFNIRNSHRQIFLLSIYEINEMFKIYFLQRYAEYSKFSKLPTSSAEVVTGLTKSHEM